MQQTDHERLETSEAEVLKTEPKIPRFESLIPTEAVPGGQSLPASSSNQPPPTMLSMPRHSLIQQRRKELKTAGSVFGRSSRNGDTLVVYPDKPFPDVHDKFSGHCPYCFVPQSLPLTDEDWRAHVDKDLQVYTCLSEHCADPIKFFHSSNDWLSHMLKEHGIDWMKTVHLGLWYCDLKHEKSAGNSIEDITFSNVVKFEIHLSEVHSLDRRKIDMFKRRKRRAGEVRVPGVCPLCEKQPNSVGQSDASHSVSKVQEHIASHLRALALLSLPELDEDPENYRNDAAISIDVASGEHGSQSVDSNTHQLLSNGDSDDATDNPDLRDYTKDQRSHSSDIPASDQWTEQLLHSLLQTKAVRFRGPDSTILHIEERLGPSRTGQHLSLQTMDSITWAAVEDVLQLQEHTLEAKSFLNSAHDDSQLHAGLQFELHELLSALGMLTETIKVGKPYSSHISLALEKCRVTLIRLVKILEQQGGGSRTWQSSEWTPESHEAAEIARTISLVIESVKTYVRMDDSTSDRTSKSPPVQSEQEVHSQKIEAWLSAPDPWTSHASARQRQEPGLGLWLLQSPSYVEWKFGPNQNLWLYGEPGIGKTVLYSTAVDDVQTSDVPLAIFYFSSSDHHKRTYGALLLSLAAQLAWKEPGLSAIQRAYEDQKTLRESELEDILLAAIPTYNEVFLMLDALDECTADGDNRHSTMYYLARLSKAAPQLKILTTSRDLPDIRDSMAVLGAESVHVPPIADRIVSIDIREIGHTSRLNPRRQGPHDDFPERGRRMQLWPWERAAKRHRSRAQSRPPPWLEEERPFKWHNERPNRIEVRQDRIEVGHDWPGRSVPEPTTTELAPSRSTVVRWQERSTAARDEQLYRRSRDEDERQANVERERRATSKRRRRRAIDDDQAQKERSRIVDSARRQQEAVDLSTLHAAALKRAEAYEHEERRRIAAEEARRTRHRDHAASALERPEMDAATRQRLDDDYDRLLEERDKPQSVRRPADEAGWLPVSTGGESEIDAATARSIGEHDPLPREGHEVEPPPRAAEDECSPPGGSPPTTRPVKVRVHNGSESPQPNPLDTPRLRPTRRIRMNEEPMSGKIS
ncbi:unnamed protein product [Zymoseptoria tritici ST99CH_1A5]|uniref:Nephrocystin 3-like N-terminal domain-containing protein n=1 Tax=Zymoseptoria tritici ST99CH_1A5 TaxID=1276529 RepID=A0A1Y6LJX2_ZYMTR|nr:unnamed protein product [Zymoseptoria tritici ST99CH_1A5]